MSRGGVNKDCQTETPTQKITKTMRPKVHTNMAPLNTSAPSAHTHANTTSTLAKEKQGR
ncbi:hypothetical protein PAXRUDRAFT_826989 [Paxillus rubicundulus Ve08.2h10]|uniref:Uncharacterized protein n=1 Tax=Paxillus rubicundulus Ve08.2h10 TaxID=930991 RepID=A0A0D0DRC4_9AGAM|nr:hypothetical protein PAXRUDRAFT_826989 [Paxillus rubicundulus Ve08.2h10]